MMPIDYYLIHEINLLTYKARNVHKLTDSLTYIKYEALNPSTLYSTALT